jgi:hypothetical protein
MFSLTEGRPIAKTDKPKPIILSIVDPDTVKIRKQQKSKKVTKPKKCCKWHDKMCRKEPCCKKCDMWEFEEELNSENYSEEEDITEDSSSSYEEREIEYIKGPSGSGMKVGIMTTFNSKKKLHPIPDLETRFIEYVAGPSGSGKSTIASELAMQFKNVYPNKPIYIFSRTDCRKDPAFAMLKPIQIAVDESLIDDPIDITQEISETGCLIIFDDCQTIHNDKIKKEVDKLMVDAMEVGRKLNCNMIITNHLVIPNEKKLARTIMNEMNMLTVFPKSGSAQQIKYTLETYWGMNNKQIKDILAINSRWLRISKNYPQYVLWDNGAKIL